MTTAAGARIATVVATVAALLGGPAAVASAVPCAPILDSVFAETFTVDLDVADKTYRRGQTALVDVTVVRPGREDPAGANVPLGSPASVPVADALVGVGVYVGEDFLFGQGITDESGTATVKVKIFRDVATGPAQVEGFSWKLIANYSCGAAYEFGYHIQTDAFRVKPARR